MYRNSKKPLNRGAFVISVIPMLIRIHRSNHKDRSQDDHEDDQQPFRRESGNHCNDVNENQQESGNDEYLAAEPVCQLPALFIV